jgi:hypothetical protein
MELQPRGKRALVTGSNAENEESGTPPPACPLPIDCGVVRAIV